MIETLKCISPIDGSVFAERPVMGHDEAADAIARTRAAQAAWASAGTFGMGGGGGIVTLAGAVLRPRRQRAGKLGVRHTPAVAEQDGRVVKISEIVLRGKG